MAEKTLAEQVEARVLSRIGIDNGHRHMTFDSFDPARSPRSLLPYQLTREFSDRSGGVLLLHGPTGTGKTHLAVSAIRHKTDQWVPWAIKSYGESALYQSPKGRFVSILLFKKQIQSNWGSKSGEAEIHKLMTDTCRATLLVLDDLGRERRAASFIETMDEIAEGREKSRRKTIITTNMTTKEIRDRYGAAFYSRMVLPACVVLLDGPDMRGWKDV